MVVADEDGRPLVFTIQAHRSDGARYVGRMIERYALLRCENAELFDAVVKLKREKAALARRLHAQSPYATPAAERFNARRAAQRHLQPV